MMRKFLNRSAIVSTLITGLKINRLTASSCIHKREYRGKKPIPVGYIPVLRFLGVPLK